MLSIPPFPVLATAVVASVSFVSLGGGIYEVHVVDHVWPKRPTIIQPSQGGLSRRRFWIPVHVAYETALLLGLIYCWPIHNVRKCLLVALGSQVTMRTWSFIDFIPKAIKFEETDADELKKSEVVRRWVRLSPLRLAIQLVTCGASLCAFGWAARRA